MNNHLFRCFLHYPQQNTQVILLNVASHLPPFPNFPRCGPHLVALGQAHISKHNNIDQQVKAPGAWDPDASGICRLGLPPIAYSLGPQARCPQCTHSTMLSPSTSPPREGDKCYPGHFLMAVLCCDYSSFQISRRCPFAQAGSSKYCPRHLLYVPGQLCAASIL